MLTFDEHYMTSINEECINQDKSFNFPFDRDSLLLSAVSLLVVTILLAFVDWTLLSLVVAQLESWSESVDSINLFLDLLFDRFLLWAIMENYDTLIKGLKV